MGEKLEACPHCGGVAVSARVDRAGRSVMYRVFCTGCLCRTEDAETREYAAATWNTRATPDRSDDALAEENRRLRREVSAVVNEMSRLMPNATEDWRARLTEALA